MITCIRFSCSKIHKKVKAMTIKVGDKIPAIGFSIMTDDGPRGVSSEEVFANKKWF